VKKRNINDFENISIITNNIVNRSVGENLVSNFLNNEWYRWYNFLLGGKEADVIDLDYKKECDTFFFFFIFFF